MEVGCCDELVPRIHAYARTNVYAVVELVHTEVDVARKYRRIAVGLAANDVVEAVRSACAGLVAGANIVELQLGIGEVEEAVVDTNLDESSYWLGVKIGCATLLYEERSVGLPCHSLAVCALKVRLGDTELPVFLALPNLSVVLLLLKGVHAVLHLCELLAQSVYGLGQNRV